MFQVVFSRYSGYDFICVKKNDESSRFEPVPFNTGWDEEDEESETSVGYVLIEKSGNETVWDPNVDEAYLPDSWFNHPQSRPSSAH